MAYVKKSSDDEGCILQRVKDYTTLVTGNKYQLRKMIRQEGCIVYDEVHDIVFKDYRFNDCILETNTNTEFKIGSSEFEIFFRKKI